MNLDITTIKQHFPILTQNPELSYLDNAATTQKPKKVIKSVRKFYRESNANVHRGIYELSEKATNEYEKARKTVAGFINAKPEEVILTSGTTDSLNLLANSLGKTPDLIKQNPKILITELEHHSNYLPWREISQDITFAELQADFKIKWPEGDFDIVAITHMSNVTGTINDIPSIRAKYPKALLVVDSAQGIPHEQIDVQSMGVDFLAFSGHKLYGPTGIGVLFGKAELLRKLYPLKVGGGMIRSVNKHEAEWAEIPERHEAGTPPIAQAVGLRTAIEFVNKVGMDKLMTHEQALREYAYNQLKTIARLEVFHPDLGIHAGAVFSFEIDGVHPHDVAQLMDQSGVAVRAGHHCCQILHREVLNIPASTRASFAVYNTKSDIDKLVESINKIKQQFS